MKPIAYMASDGSLHYHKERAGPHAIPLIPMPIPLTTQRIISAARRIKRDADVKHLDLSLVRAIEREHGILSPEDC
jgi:hypothetical protein